MIYIEVIFGSINGNAIDVDAAMSDTSTNPVQNKVIKAALDALQRNIDAVAGSITKDVVEVETYDDLADIEEPRTDVIYVTTDTNKLYLYDAETGDFNDVTDTAIDNTIYVTNLASLFDMDLSNGLYTVSYTHRTVGSNSTVIYSLSVQSRTRIRLPRPVTVVEMILANADGYAVKGYDDNDDPIWVWTLYSVEGHTHETSEINGLSDAMNLKQNATDNSLNTDNKTVVGAINEVNLVRKREYSMNFYGVNDIAQEHNLSGRALTLGKIATANVQSLSYSILNGAQNVSVSLSSGEWNAGGTPSAITLPQGALITWKVQRADDSQPAEITIKEA